MESLQQPKIDIQEIQNAANAAAKKAYLKAIEDYYTSYNSPYKEMINENLKKQEFKYNLELPDVISKINDALSSEIDAIANNCIATSFIPKISEALVGFKKEINLSEILQEIINELEPDMSKVDIYDYNFTFSRNENKKYGWLDCTISTPDNTYEFTLHNDGSYFDKELKPIKNYKYSLLSMPGDRTGGASKKMTIYKDDIKIEMPFTPNILSDKIMNIFFKIMLGGCNITIDIDDFCEDMFPSDEHCNC